MGVERTIGGTDRRPHAESRGHALLTPLQSALGRTGVEAGDVMPHDAALLWAELLLVQPPRVLPHCPE